ncbi:MAG TPA: PfkB family carbohydrate kinase, partial [Oceanipulchritudo sp.]|nr:PfkB family carbohydrate kinase [Oceanipulchritudo sp.]
LFPDSKDQPTPSILARARQDSPVLNWIITDGPRPVIAATKSDGLFTIEPATIEEVSPTGSGDTFLAALLKQLILGTKNEEALRYAGACATANAASPGIGDFPLPVPEQYLPVVRPTSYTSS